MALIREAALVRGVAYRRAARNQLGGPRQPEAYVIGMGRETELSSKGANQMELGQPTQANERIDRHCFAEVRPQVIADRAEWCCARHG
jgi:hypothetical protein